MINFGCDAVFFIPVEALVGARGARVCVLLPDAAWLCKTSNRQSSVRLRIFKFLRALLSLACVHHYPPPQKNKCFKIGNMSSNAEIEVPVCQELEKS